MNHSYTHGLGMPELDHNNEFFVELNNKLNIIWPHRKKSGILAVQHETKKNYDFRITHTLGQSFVEEVRLKHFLWSWIGNKSNQNQQWHSELVRPVLHAVLGGSSWESLAHRCGRLIFFGHGVCQVNCGRTKMTVLNHVIHLCPRVFLID